VRVDRNEPGGARTKSISRRGAALAPGSNMRQAVPTRKNENLCAREEIKTPSARGICCRPRKNGARMNHRTCSGKMNLEHRTRNRAGSVV
jgi:hypothetical protein